MSEEMLALALGSASLLFVIDSVLANQEKAPTSQTKIPTSTNAISGVDAVGPLYFDVEMDGFIAPFYIGRINKSNLVGAIAFTDGMYEGSSRAEDRHDNSSIWKNHRCNGGCGYVSVYTFEAET
jgi:hypothetical protein